MSLKSCFLQNLGFTNNFIKLATGEEDLPEKLTGNKIYYIKTDSFRKVRSGNNIEEINIESEDRINEDLYSEYEHQNDFHKDDVAFNFYNEDKAEPEFISRSRKASEACCEQPSRVLLNSNTNYKRIIPKSFSDENVCEFISFQKTAKLTSKTTQHQPLREEITLQLKEEEENQASASEETETETEKIQQTELSNYRFISSSIDIEKVKKLENLCKNINSDATNSEKIIKAYKSKLKSKNWSTYIENSKLNEKKNQFKFYHKCNFPGCTRTFSSSGWLKTHLEDHFKEIKNEKFNQELQSCIKKLKENIIN